MTSSAFAACTCGSLMAGFFFRHEVKVKEL